MRCEECETEPKTDARGWIGLRTDLPDEEEQPETVFYCPSCAEREFGARFANRNAKPS
jgi:hypothetical protein